MQTQAYYNEPGNDIPGDMDREELLRSVMTLRQDVVSIAADVREVLSENAKLKQEVSRLQERGGSNKSVSEISRLKREVDQLLQLHEAASSRPGMTRKAPRRVQDERSDSTDTAAWTKKMMMVMMLAEMI